MLCWVRFENGWEEQPLGWSVGIPVKELVKVCIGLSLLCLYGVEVTWSYDMAKLWKEQLPCMASESILEVGSEIRHCIEQLVWSVEFRETQNLHTS